MRKIYLVLLFLLAGIFTEVAAKKGTVSIQGPDYHEANHISPNGKWICGMFGKVIGNRAFLWDVENNKITYFGEELSEAWGVANDGTVCGIFSSSAVSDNGASQPTGGYWKDGKLHLLTDEEGNPVLCTADAITPDGQYIGGSIIEGTSRKPCIWKNGKLERRLNNDGKNGVISAISDDGQIAVGFYMYKNRTCCYWSGTEVTRLAETGGFDNNAFAISPNKKYILAQDNDGKFIYDVEQNKVITRIDNLTNADSWAGIQIMDDATAILWEGSGALFCDGIIYHKDGSWEKAKTWLKDKMGGTVPSEITSGPTICRFSRDMKVMVGLCMSGVTDYGTAIYCPTAWVSDQEVDTAKPVSLVSKQVPGTSFVMLNWKKPFANSENIKNYLVYRNGEKIADVTSDKLAYTDKTASTANVTYNVSALYEGGESEKLESKITVTKAQYAERPSTFSTYQSNYNSVVLNWTMPNNGYDVAIRRHNDEFAFPFGAGSDMTYWIGVDFNSTLVNSYSDGFKLTAVELYPYEAVAEEMELEIYSNDKVLHSQAIDLKKLVLGRNNVITLNKEVALPTDGGIRLVLKIVQSGAGSPIGMAEGPAIEGGDLMSEDGTEWSTLSERSERGYDYNWMLGMLLKSNAGSSNIVSSYKVYRDGEFMQDIVSPVNGDGDVKLSCADKNVALGAHNYEIEAIYNDVASARKASNILVYKKDINKCMTPINLTGTPASGSKYNFNWDMPENIEFSYSNWIANIGMTMLKTAEFYGGVKYEAEKMRPFAGANITAVNFWPRENVTYSLHIFEGTGDKEIYSQDIPQYTVNRLNNVKLKTPIEVRPYQDYIVAIKVSGVKDEQKPFGLDTSYPYPNANGRLVAEIPKSSSDVLHFRDPEMDGIGNLMIGIEMERTTKGFNPGLSYKVYVDGNVESETTDNNYAKSIAELSGPKTVKVSVAAIYPTGEKKSNEITVTLDPAAGIGENEISVVKVYPNPAKSFIHIEGNVSQITIFNTAGQEIYRNDNISTIDVAGFTPGFYMLKSVIDGKVYVNKIQITE